MKTVFEGLACGTLIAGFIGGIGGFGLEYTIFFGLAGVTLAILAVAAGQKS